VTAEVTKLRLLKDNPLAICYTPTSISSLMLSHTTMTVSTIVLFL
jgi:hypothetical protein